MKKQMTADERAYLSKLVDLGCVVCLRHLSIKGSPAEVHHIRTGKGMGQRAKHVGETIPLCPMHHRLGGYGVALHAGKKEFEKNFSTELELLEFTNWLLEQP